MAKYVDFVILPIAKKNIAAYKKSTMAVGKILLKHGALASRDFIAEDNNATKLMFPKLMKLKPGELIIVAVAEFNSKAHRNKVFKLLEKDPAMEKIMSSMPMEKRTVMGGFKSLVDLEK